MDNVHSPQEEPLIDPKKRLIAIRYIGLGGFEKNPGGSLMLFVPASLYKTFVRDKEHSGVPLLPIPVPPFFDALYKRRLTHVTEAGNDPDIDIFRGYCDISGIRVKKIAIRAGGPEVYGTMTIVTKDEKEADLPIDFRYTIIEAVLYGIPIMIEQGLFDQIMSQINVDAHFPDTDPDTVTDDELQDPNPELVESLGTYLNNRIADKSNPDEEDPDLKNQLLALDEEELMTLLDHSLENEAYEWTAFLRKILTLKKGTTE